MLIIRLGSPFCIPLISMTVLLSEEWQFTSLSHLRVCSLTFVRHWQAKKMWGNNSGSLRQKKQCEFLWLVINCVRRGSWLISALRFCCQIFLERCAFLVWETWWVWSQSFAVFWLLLHRINGRKISTLTLVPKLTCCVRWRLLVALINFGNVREYNKDKNRTIY